MMENKGVSFGGLYYAIPLWDYATPPFCSFSKDYFGSFSEIEGFINDIYADDSEEYSDIKTALEKFKQGRKDVTYCVAYQERRLLKPVEIIAEEILTFQAREWEYENIWNCIYVLKCDGGKFRQMVLRHENKYYRCVKALFKNLYYNDEDRKANMWLPLDGMFWGHPCMIKAEKLGDSDFELQCALYCTEQIYDNCKEALFDLGSIEKINWSSLCMDIFGDG